MVKNMAPSTHRQDPSKKLYWTGLAAAAAGVGIQTYLTSLHYSLKYGGDGGAADSICNINETFNCVAVAASRYAEVFGVPLALWGALTNVALLVLASIYPFSEERVQARRNVLILSGFIAAASIVMALISATQLTTYCAFCILAYVTSFIAFFAFWKGLRSHAVGKSGGGPAASEVAAGLLSTGAGSMISRSRSLLIAGLVVFLGAFIVNNGAKKAYIGGQAASGSEFTAQIQAFVNEWQTNPKLTIDTVEPLVKGNPDPNAKVTIVEFADFRCSHCRVASPTLDAFVKSHPDVRLLFQAWPLDGECNSAIDATNGASCALARAAYCAASSATGAGQASAKLGWKAHEWIFSHQTEFSNLEAVNSRLPQMSAELGLKVDELKSCMDSEAARKAIEGQARLGTRLKVQGTPAIFVNGRQLPAGQALPVLQLAYERIQSGQLPD